MFRRRSIPPPMVWWPALVLLPNGMVRLASLAGSGTPSPMVWLALAPPCVVCFSGVLKFHYENSSVSTSKSSLWSPDVKSRF